MWFQEKSWTELRASLDSNHFDDSRSKHWNTMQLQLKNSFSYRNPSLLGCLLTIHQVQWNPWFRKPQHRIISVCLLPFSSMLHLKHCSPFQLTRVSAQLLDYPILTQEVKNTPEPAGLQTPPKPGCSSFIQTPDNSKERSGMLLPSRGFVATSFQTRSKIHGLPGKKQEGWL